MKKLFIYYSFTGNGELIEKVFENKGYEIRKATPKKSLPKSFFWGVMTGGFLAGLNHKSKLLDFDHNVEEFEEVVIGSPVWNGRFSTPINTVLAKTNLKNKKLTFVFYSGSGEAEKATKRIKKEYPEAKIIILKEPKKHSEELDKLNEL